MQIFHKGSRCLGMQKEAWIFGGRVPQKCFIFSPNLTLKYVRLRRLQYTISD